MPGKAGKLKGKKKLKKSNNCKGTEQEDMPAQSCGLKDENVLSKPIKKDTLATEFSSILDDFKNNNKVNMSLEEHRGKDIVKSLLQAAIKRGDQEEVRRGSDEVEEKVGDEDTEGELKEVDQPEWEGETRPLQNSEQQRNLFEEHLDLHAGATRIANATSNLCEEVLKLDLQAPMSNGSENEEMRNVGSILGMELEFLQEDEVEKNNIQRMNSSEHQLPLREVVEERRVPEGCEAGNIVKGVQDSAMDDQTEPAREETEEPVIKLQQGVFELTLERGKENIVVKSESDLVPISTGEQHQWTRLETVSAPALGTLKHPLQHEWTFWHLNPDKNLKWSEKQQEIKTVGTVEDFWAVYNWTLFPSQLRLGSDYSLFKAGVRPDWEDERNVRGGRWMVLRSRDQLDHGWKEIAMALVGETLGVGLDERVTGAVVNVRGKMDKICVWVGDNTLVDRIGERLQKVLGISDRMWGHGAEYRRHK